MFTGHVEVVTGEKQARVAAEYLMKQKRVGIDTETRPTFNRGCMHKVALLQVATDEVCFLFRLNRIGLPQCIVDLLESDKITKVGLSLNDDFAMLRHRCDTLQPHNVVELQKIAPRLGIEDMSLQKLCANILGEYISKRQQLTNWEADSLSEAQKRYAATDAWACLRLQDSINHLINTHDYQFVPYDQDNT